MVSDQRGPGSCKGAAKMDKLESPANNQLTDYLCAQYLAFGQSLTSFWGWYEFTVSQSNGE